MRPWRKFAITEIKKMQKFYALIQDNECLDMFIRLEFILFEEGKKRLTLPLGFDRVRCRRRIFPQMMQIFKIESVKNNLRLRVVEKKEIRKYIVMILRLLTFCTRVKSS